jgi:hypothetical protein
VNPENPFNIGPAFQAMEMAAQSLKLGLQQFPVRGPNEFESAFERMEQAGIQGVMIVDDGMLNANRVTIATMAAKQRFISIGNKEFAQVGGLIGYGVDYFATFHRAAA